MVESSHTSIRPAEGGISCRNNQEMVILKISLTFIESTFGTIYRYSSGRLGLTQCTPLYKNSNFYGATCFDIFPTAAKVGNNSFIENNYFPGSNLNYLFFNRDANYVSP